MPDSLSRRLPPCRRSSTRPAAQRARGHRWPTDRFRLPGQACGVGEADNTANVSTARTRLNGHPPPPRASAHGEPVQPADMETDLHGAQDYHRAHALASKASDFFSPAGRRRRAAAIRRHPARTRRNETALRLPEAAGGPERQRRRNETALRLPEAAGGAVVAVHESCFPVWALRLNRVFRSFGIAALGLAAVFFAPGGRSPRRSTARHPGRADAAPRPPGPRRRPRSRRST